MWTCMPHLCAHWLVSIFLCVLLFSVADDDDDDDVTAVIIVIIPIGLTGLSKVTSLQKRPFSQGGITCADSFIW